MSEESRSHRFIRIVLSILLVFSTPFFDYWAQMLHAAADTAIHGAYQPSYQTGVELMLMLIWWTLYGGTHGWRNFGVILMMTPTFTA